MKDSPVARFWARQLVVAAVSYLAAALAQGQIADWSAFGWGLGAALCSTLLGLLGPQEPFVGRKYPATVPVPPADPEPAK